MQLHKLEDSFFSTVLLFMLHGGRSSLEHLSFRDFLRLVSYLSPKLGGPYLQDAVLSLITS